MDKEKINTKNNKVIDEEENIYDRVLNVTSNNEWEMICDELEERYNVPFKMIGKYDWDEIINAIDVDASLILYGMDKDDVIKELEEEYNKYLEEEYEYQLLRDYYYSGR
ncbi:hypothetical protein DW028_12870 [Agathobacter rectalis]|jgi:hypothetical protein|uniref:Uncharacterized protein n=1 Tax=Agathobacter rectalis TaxID=39491 RepID=A0A415JS71_9FIRM|nr:hypothetical protein [Agathobacter rectalis]RHL26838.1 hypothetical protein DW028_12870 [Agathobacter rectalis]